MARVRVRSNIYAALPFLACLVMGVGCYFAVQRLMEYRNDDIRPNVTLPPLPGLGDEEPAVTPGEGDTPAVPTPGTDVPDDDAPAPDGADAPADDGAVPPADDGAAPPADDGAAPPADGGAAPPADAGKTVAPPAGGADAAKGLDEEEDEEP